MSLWLKYKIVLVQVILPLRKATFKVVFYNSAEVKEPNFNSLEKKFQDVVLSLITVFLDV